MPPVKRLAITLAAAALSAGCGGASSRTDQVKSDWRAAASAMARGDGATACKYFTPAVSSTLSSSSGASCQDAVSELAAPLTAADRASLANATITSVTVSGDNATITYKLTPGLSKLGFKGRSRLTRSSSGRWLIAPRSA